MTRPKARLAALLGIGSILSMHYSASALPPAPANDDPGSAQVIGPATPIIVYGTTVLANNSINATTLPAPAAEVDGPDVFYSFTPGATATYRIELIPWQLASLRTSDRQFTVYVQDPGNVFIAGARATSSANPLQFNVALTAATTYRIGVDYNSSNAQDNFPFTLLVDTLPATNPDTCASAIVLSNALPEIVLNDINAATGNFTFTQSTDRCAIQGSVTGAGRDHVYQFTPAADGEYTIELASSFNSMLYVDDSCPPFFPDGCLGASDHASAATASELVTVSLTGGTDYFIYVDATTNSVTTGFYALIVAPAATYQINEVEPNNSGATASPLVAPVSGAQLAGPSDEDWWAVNGNVGDKVYAWTFNGGAAASTLDLDLALIDANTSTTLEFDDDDADGADAPIQDLRFIYSTSSAVIAGAPLASNGTSYLKVTKVSANSTSHRYLLPAGVEPGTRSPAAECEPNEATGNADRSAKHYYSGAITSGTDVDTFAFDANAGDIVFIAADGDPERDSLGFTTANSDPLAFHPKLIVLDPAGDILISDISDSNAAQGGLPDFPGQAGYFVARTTGRHYVQVTAQSTVSQTGPTETYELAIFINGPAAPALAEDVDPVINATPDTVNDVVNVVATDNAVGDSGICNVELVGATNLQLTGVVFTPGDPSASFAVELVNGALNGFGKLIVTDCEGNTDCEVIQIDVTAPVCGGTLYSVRGLDSLHGIIPVPSASTNTVGTIDIPDAGTISDVNVTVTIECANATDIDLFLESPLGTRVELITDRGSSSALNVTDATFDDSAATIMSALSGDEPYTGSWLPEGVGGLAAFNGENAQGTWELNVQDDTGGSPMRLVRWTLNVRGSFAAPQSYDGTVTDNAAFDSGIQSIVLNNAVNTQITLHSFNAGDQTATYTVTLIDSTTNGSGDVDVTDLQGNTCTTPIALTGLPDTTAPSNSGSVTTDQRFSAEVQADVPLATPAGVVSTVNVSNTDLVGEVESDITIDSIDIGRIASTLTHGGQFASLVNRTGMDERGSVGLTKDIIDITLDDDAPVADDAHLEPALGTVDFVGPHQPDGRGQFIGDGINTDDRDNMLLNLAGQSGAGNWDLFVGDFRIQGASRAIFRRWAMRLKSPCGAQRYYGQAVEAGTGTGISSISLAGGAVNLSLSASFTPGDLVVNYLVELVDPTQPGSGTVDITDGAGNVAMVPMALAAASVDVNLPIVGGSVNLMTDEFNGTASDVQTGDTGVASITLEPWSTNLQIVSVTPGLPAGNASFTVGLVNPAANGRGYVRVTDVCGWRSHVLVEIDAVDPTCAGDYSRTKRFLSAGGPTAIPDNTVGGITSDIIVADPDIVSDVNVSLYITHGFDDDLDLTLLSPSVLTLFNDIGSTGNDFFNTILDDEASGVIPDSAAAAPFDASYQCSGGPAVLSALDGNPAFGTYTLRVADDAAFNLGTLDAWAVTIESATFPRRFAGEARDGASLDTGVASVAMAPGANNLTVNVEPTYGGGKLVIYEVVQTNPVLCGSGTLVVTDSAGNTCTRVISLPNRPGDTNGDNVADVNDVGTFVLALLGGADCAADVNGDGVVDGDDIEPFTTCIITGPCP